MELLKTDRAKLAAIFVLAVAMRLVHLGSPLLDGQACRQTETASIARGFAEEHFDPFTPRLDLFAGSPGVELELQLYTAVVAAAAKLLGFRDVIGRLTSLVAALVALLYVLRLGRRWLTGNGALWAALFFAASPLAVFFGRNFQPDMTMLAFLVASVFHLDRALFDRAPHVRWGQLVAAGTCASLAIALKLPAAHIGLVHLALFWRRFGWKTFGSPAGWIFLLLALAPPAAWYVRAHRIGEESGITFMLGYNKNKLAELSTFLDPGYWRVLYLDRPVRLCFGFVGFGLLLFSALPWRGAAGGTRRVLGVWIASVVVYFLLVAKGNLIHNHYQLPLVPAGCLLIGLAIERLSALGAFATNRRRWIGIALLIAGFIQGQASIAPQYRYNPVVAEAGRAYAAVAPADERVVAVGAEYNTLLYYCRRKGWSYWDFTDLTAGKLAEVRAQGARALVAVHPDDLIRSPLWGKELRLEQIAVRGPGYWILRL